MGSNFSRHNLPLVKFHELFQRAHWEILLPHDSSLARSSDSPPEACYRLWVDGEQYEVSYHEPIEQISLSVCSLDKRQRYNLFFFLGGNSVSLIKKIQQLVHSAKVDFFSMNRLLEDTKPYCHFTLLELPGEGLYEVGPRKALI
jgi:hypothetical protein